MNSIERVRNTTTTLSAHARRLATGAFELQGIPGGSPALGAEGLGIRMACPHPALVLFDDKDVLLSRRDRPARPYPRLPGVKNRKRN